MRTNALATHACGPTTTGLPPACFAAGWLCAAAADAAAAGERSDCSEALWHISCAGCSLPVLQLSLVAFLSSSAPLLRGLLLPLCLRNFCCCVTLQVIVEGWKSYKDQTILEPFSPKVNVIGER